MRYEGTVYRPPSEANSLIIQLTIGCARNTCTFCSMFKEKTFRVRPLSEVVEDLMAARSYYQNIPVKRVFLADGDALIVKSEELLYILEEIQRIFPEVERISAYGAPADVLAKSEEELSQLQKAGLKMIYMGAESGNDEVLEQVKKGVSAAQIIAAGQKLKKAHITTSVTFISGLGGTQKLTEHALGTAHVINQMQPDYVGFLTLMLEPGTPLYEQVKRGEFQVLEPEDIVMELKLLIENIDSPGTIFRSNHASNYISLRGTFNEDREQMLQQIQETMEKGSYKPEKFRGL